MARGDRDRVQHSGTPYPKRTISPTAVEASRKPADPVASRNSRTKRGPPMTTRGFERLTSFACHRPDHQGNDSCPGGALREQP